VSDTSVRYKLTIAYRGTRYHGWQIQGVPETYTKELADGATEIPTVQGALRRALVDVLGHPVNVAGSSRTDTGVHAKGQVAHVDTTATQIPVEGLRRAVNSRLPDDVLVRRIEPVAPTFNAITDTVTKRYQYLIWRASDRPVFAGDLAWHRWQELDVAAMAEAARRLVGTHDFASFARPGHGRENTVRTVHACDVHFRAPRLVIGVEGGGFLWNMVRIMVGTLVEVGLKRTTPEAISDMLAAKDRRAAGPTAPAHGLYLQWIKHAAASAPLHDHEYPRPSRPGINLQNTDKSPN